MVNLVEYSLVVVMRTDDDDDSAPVFDAREVSSHERDDAFRRDVAGKMQHVAPYGRSTLQYHVSICAK